MPQCTQECVLILTVRIRGKSLPGAFRGNSDVGGTGNERYSRRMRGPTSTHRSRSAALRGCSTSSSGHVVGRTLEALANGVEGKANTSALAGRRAGMRYHEDRRRTAEQPSRPARLIRGVLNKSGANNIIAVSRHRWDVSVLPPSRAQKSRNLANRRLRAVVPRRHGVRTGPRLSGNWVRGRCRQSE